MCSPGAASSSRCVRCIEWERDYRRCGSIGVLAIVQWHSSELIHTAVGRSPFLYPGCQSSLIVVNTTHAKYKFLVVPFVSWRSDAAPHCRDSRPSCVLKVYIHSPFPSRSRVMWSTLPPSARLHCTCGSHLCLFGARRQRIKRMLLHDLSRTSR